MEPLADACSVAEQVRTGALTATEVAEGALARIAALNTGVNAFVAVRSADDILIEAARIDSTVREGGDPGPLAGVPVAVKDVDAVAGLPTRAGSMTTSNAPAEGDSTHIARLRSAGAIPIGKTNVPEFAYSIDTRNRLFGNTKNPRRPELSPGGSSGGSAAAVASGMVPLATGGDGGGSIRIPAAFCGVVGLKPTFGRVPLENDPWGELSHLGVFATSVRDTARYLDIVSGASPLDRLSLPRSGETWESALPKGAGRLRDFSVVASVRLHGAEVAEEVEDVFIGAVESLHEGGLRISWREELFPDVLTEFLDLASYREGVRLQTFSEAELSELGRGYRAWCERGAAVTAGKIAKAEDARDLLFIAVERLLGDHSLLITPTMGMLPWRLDQPASTDPLAAMLTHPFNMTGHPAISIPIQDSLVGIQVVAGRFCESLLLRFAHVAVRHLTGDLASRRTGGTRR